MSQYISNLSTVFDFIIQMLHTIANLMVSSPVLLASLSLFVLYKIGNVFKSIIS